MQARDVPSSTGAAKRLGFAVLYERLFAQTQHMSFGVPSSELLSLEATAATIARGRAPGATRRALNVRDKGCR
jgi:hypothetical protein